MDLLRHLLFFTTVADTRHFGHAAQDLGMTQPPLSQGIQRLEQRLEVRLFDRDSRGVRLTGAGQQLLGPARDLVRAAGDFAQLARDLSEPTQARLGLCDDLGPWIPLLCRRLAAAGLDVTPELAGSTALVNRLRDGLLDVAVVRHPGVVDGLDAGEVLRLPTELVTSDGPSTQALRVIDRPVVVPPRHHQPPAHDQFVDALRRAGHDGDVIQSPDAAQRDALVSAARAVTVRPRTDGGQTGLPPLRVRVVLDSGRARRPEIEHAALVRVLDETLTP